MEQATSESEPSEEAMRRAVIVLVGHAVKQLDDGHSPVEVQREFVERGFAPEVALRLVDNAHQVRAQRDEQPSAPHQRHQNDPIFARMQEGQQKADGHADMVAGGLICLVGILITAATYSAASGGGTYVVAWGAILFGGIRFFRGLAA